MISLKIFGLMSINKVDQGLGSNIHSELTFEGFYETSYLVLSYIFLSIVRVWSEPLVNEMRVVVLER